MSEDISGDENCNLVRQEQCKESSNCNEKSNQDMSDRLHDKTTPESSESLIEVTETKNESPENMSTKSITECSENPKLVLEPLVEEVYGSQFRFPSPTASKDTAFCDVESENRRNAAYHTLIKLQNEWQSSQPKRRKRRTRKFYATQDDFIKAIQEAEENVCKDKLEAAGEEAKMEKAVMFAAKLSFVVNIVLMLAKLAASILSGSMAVISSLVDSIVDLVSGAVIYYTTRAAKKANLHFYPFGRSRLEPAAIIIISVVMGLASLQVQIQSIGQIVRGDIEEPDYQWQIVMGSAHPEMELTSIVMVATTIVSKLVLFLICRRIPSPSTETLALDHRNDTIGNSFALICGYVGSSFPQLRIVDPIGAILISLYILVNWWKTGSDQMKVITGKTAPPEVIAKITWLALYHDSRIKNIDTVRAFHLGSGFLTEVHITLDEHMSLRESHDIGESLQCKLELLSEVEVAFVHLDYENSHSAAQEHAILMRKSTDRQKSPNSLSERGSIV